METRDEVSKETDFRAKGENIKKVWIIMLRVGLSCYSVANKEQTPSQPVIPVVKRIVPRIAHSSNITHYE